MELITAQLVEGVLSSLFDYLKLNVLFNPSKKAIFDFLIKDESDNAIAIEVKGDNITHKTISMLLRNFKRTSLYSITLITPNECKDDRIKFFNEQVKSLGIKAEWLSINQFLDRYGFSANIDSLKDDIRNLQLATVTSKIDLYKDNVIGSHLGTKELSKTIKSNLEKVKKGSINETNTRLYLRRQFPDSVISNLPKTEVEISNFLNFGKKYEDAIVIMTDIKNFSSLVTVSDPDELNELMGKYYTNARNLVFKYGGILDKFIGDAVLAIFNFPHHEKESFEKAVKFSSELILMGEQILQEFSKKLDQNIETGTRIGMASGVIYPLNIGTDEIEITFIGDKINFAARLEKNSEVDGILISNRYYHKLEEYSNEFLQKLNCEQKILDKDQAKGQMGDSITWQINRESILKMYS